MSFSKKTGSSSINLGNIEVGESKSVLQVEAKGLLQDQIKQPGASVYGDMLVSLPSSPLISQFALDALKDPTGPINESFSTGFDFGRVIQQSEPIAAPSYEIASETFGVLKHIDAPNSMFLEAKFNIEKLRDELSLEAGAENILTRIRDYIQDLYDNSDVDPDILKHFFEDITEPDGEVNRKLAPLTFRLIPKIGQEFVVKDFNEEDAGATGTFKENDRTALFGSGKALRDDIREIQKLRSALIAFRRWQQKQLKLKQTERERIRDEIPTKHREMANLNRKRIEARGDYQVVQQLVREDWQKVSEQYAERAEILNNHQGLFYARVRETPFSRPLPRELPLRHASPDDIVPGCPMEDQDLPEELQTFMDTVLDIPIGSWRTLRLRLGKRR